MHSFATYLVILILLDSKNNQEISKNILRCVKQMQLTKLETLTIKLH